MFREAGSFRGCEHFRRGGRCAADGERTGAGFHEEDEFADGLLLGWGEGIRGTDEADGEFAVLGILEPAVGGFDGAVWGAVAIADDEVPWGTVAIVSAAGLEIVELGGIAAWGAGEADGDGGERCGQPGGDGCAEIGGEELPVAAGGGVCGGASGKFRGRGGGCLSGGGGGQGGWGQEDIRLEGSFLGSGAQLFHEAAFALAGQHLLADGDCDGRNHEETDHEPNLYEWVVPPELGLGSWGMTAGVRERGR